MTREVARVYLQELESMVNGHDQKIKSFVNNYHNSSSKVRQSIIFSVYLLKEGNKFRQLPDEIISLIVSATGEIAGVSLLASTLIEEVIEEDREFYKDLVRVIYDNQSTLNDKSLQILLPLLKNHLYKEHLEIIKPFLDYLSRGERGKELKKVVEQLL
jgi:hypothetical protein